MNNSIFVIKPYKWEGLWVFDDANVGLVKEPFVGGADTMIDIATAHLPNAEKGFVAAFSANYFPNAQIVLEWAKGRRRRQRLSLEGQREGGLAVPGAAPLFCRRPAKLYIQVKPAP